MEAVRKKVIDPTVAGLHKDNLDYKGFIFFGLMKVGDDPYVIEYNCRMGDPETEVVLPRIKNDLVQLLIDTAHGKLDAVKLEKDKRFATTIVAVSGGYPNDYKKGYPISGLRKVGTDEFLFHSGTRIAEDKVVTNGGRVICATALAPELEEALDLSKELVELVQFEGKYFRSDIGFEFTGHNRISPH